LDRPAWLAFLSDLRYTLDHDGGSFIQLAQPHDHAWPVDLMVVTEPTFAQHGTPDLYEKLSRSLAND
jgi:hypothetical protein